MAMWSRQVLRFLRGSAVISITGALRKPQPNGGVIYEVQFPKSFQGSASGAGVEIGYVLPFNDPPGTAGSGNFLRLSANYDGTGAVVQVAKPLLLREGYYLTYPGRTFTFPDGAHTYTLVDANTRLDTVGANGTEQTIWPPYVVGDAINYFDFGAAGQFQQYAPAIGHSIPGLLVNLMALPDSRRWLGNYTVCDPNSRTNKDQYVDASMPF